ncbi:unnamed protein product [Acanthoscelides obtectus]|uniref:Uncharacterized protein n=1 Tax=Acanthoscelides obtectus TaxID=200917 RepID=A0A9P0JPG1_ACAOB|nr:unnamed protein product [Acanthoscelides obtectus]CAK1642842.1 hypothetical protein AOBTE_LOCUS13238 [Acanthoscelides obtectus]
MQYSQKKMFSYLTILAVLIILLQSVHVDTVLNDTAESSNNPFLSDHCFDYLILLIDNTGDIHLYKFCQTYIDCCTVSALSKNRGCRVQTRVTQSQGVPSGRCHELCEGHFWGRQQGRTRRRRGS